MSSEIKVDTISEKTSANGVVIDGVTVKDGAIASSFISGLSSGKVLQVVQATSSTSTNTTATTYGNTTLTGSITPSATGSKVLVLISQILDVSSNATQNNEGAIKVVRTISSSDTDIYENTAFTKINADYGAFGYAQVRGTYSILILDTPSTTSATTYKTQMKNNLSNGSCTAQISNMPSHIILMEIGA
jgi:hypothetical protein